MKRNLKVSAKIAALVLVFTTVISCEKDFADIGASIISNTKFSTNSILVDVTLENAPVTNLRSDNLTFEPGTYLLGVHTSADYEKIEASIVSQIAVPSGLTLLDAENTYVSDTTVITTIDTAFVKLPYQVSLNDTSTGYELDSIIGDKTKAFDLNIFQLNTYLSRLNPADPSKVNSYYSNDVFEKAGAALNTTNNFKLIPKATDTAIVVKRWLNNGALYNKDTVTYTNSTAVTVPLPFAAIPLKEDVIKSLFLDKYESAEFETQDAFNNYFRGVILEATGNEGSLISLNFNGTNTPSIEIYYTNTVIANGVAIDTISKNHSFPLAGIRAATYKMEDKVYPTNEEVIIQGAAGSEGVLTLFGADADGNGLADKIEELRAQNLLVNDALLTMYVKQSADTTAIPYRLYLYKSDEAPTPTYSIIKDVYSENIASFGGLLERGTDDQFEKYTFRITDYISDILNGNTNYSPTLRLKAINATDLQTVTDTIFKNYSWNPKAVTLLNHSAINGDKKVELKISYSEKK